MRREGFELQVGAPVVIMHEEEGQKMEPVERVTISVPSEAAGSVIAELFLWKTVTLWHTLSSIFKKEELSLSNLKPNSMKV